MLQIKNLSFTHLKDLSQLLNQLSLTIHSGDKVAIIGEEGTGKSNLLKYLYNPNCLEDYLQISGQVYSDYNKVLYLPQELESETASKRLTDYIYNGEDLDHLDLNSFFQLAQACHFNLDLLDKEDISLVDLSGGERIKLQIIKALAMHPDCLLLDEPSSDLDLDTLIWLEKMISETDQTVIFISHDEAFLSSCATAVLHLELTQKRRKPKWTFFKGSYPEYKNHRQEEYDKQLQIATKERDDFQKKEAKQKRIQSSLHHQLNATKDSTAGRLLAKKMKNIKSQERKLSIAKEELTEIPDQLESISLFFSNIEQFASSKTLLHWENRQLETGQKINLLIRGQDKIVITGENGIGKSRLLKEIVAELSQKASFSWCYMPQNYDDLMSTDEKVLDFLAFDDQEKARSLLASLQFTREEINHETSQLSGGQKAKLFLAKMVLHKSQLLILDEPTRHFSPTSQPLVRDLFAHFPGAIISVSHDRAFIEQDYLKKYHLNTSNLL